MGPDAVTSWTGLVCWAMIGLWVLAPIFGVVVARVSVTRGWPMLRWKLAAVIVGIVSWLVPMLWLMVVSWPYLADWFWLVFLVFAAVVASPSAAVGFPMVRDLRRSGR